MMSNGLQSNNVTGDFSSTTKQLSNILPEAPQQIHDTEVSKQTSIEITADDQRMIEEKDVRLDLIKIVFFIYSFNSERNNKYYFID